MISVFHTQGDGHGWAIDEDLRQIRESLRGVVRETSLARAQVVHAPFWMALDMHPPDVLAGRFVIAHADNPPFFYLKQPEFVRAQQQVDLWVARSREAEGQFRALGLPVEYIPYTIDPGLFFPIVSGPAEKSALRRRLGLPEGTYLIANFHRDSEGSALDTPKLQKAPELMLMILRRLRELGVPFHVLLAGPRRHWLRGQLEQENLPFTFVGKPGLTGDDFGINILTRPQLNELYNAADLYLIPSRWEGGPQSVMEAAACRCKILSTPLGLARDILNPECLFHTASQAADVIARDITENHLASTVAPQWERWQSQHTSQALTDGLRALYANLPSLPEFTAKAVPTRKAVRAHLIQWRHTVRRRLAPRTPPRSVVIHHESGHDSALDGIMTNVRESLERSGITVGDTGLVLRGWTQNPEHDKGGIQFFSPTAALPLSPLVTVVAPSVQDVVNLRARGCSAPAVVIPFLFQAGAVSDDPLVLAEGRNDASLEVWQALLDGRPVVYPENSAYYEQVFHAGIPCRAGEDPAAVVQLARKTIRELRELARPPRASASAQALRKLLTDPNGIQSKRNPAWTK